MAAESSSSSWITRTKDATNRILLLEVSATDGSREYKELTIREWLQEITRTINVELAKSSPNEPSGQSIPIRAGYAAASSSIEEIKSSGNVSDLEFSVSAGAGNVINALEGIEMRSPRNAGVVQSSLPVGDRRPFISDENYRVPNIPSSTSLSSLAALASEPGADLTQATSGQGSSISSTDPAHSESRFRRRRSIPKTDAIHGMPTSGHLPHRVRAGSVRVLAPMDRPSTLINTDDYFSGEIGESIDGESNIPVSAPRIHGVTMYHEYDLTQGDNSAAAVLGLRIRDLRRLDFSSNMNEAIDVQIRRHAVLFSADPLRAVITATKLWVVIPPGADSLIKYVDDHLQEWHGTSPNQVSSANGNKQESIRSHSGGSGSGSNTPTTVQSADHNPFEHSRTELHFEGHCFETLLSTAKNIIDSEANSLIDKGQKMLKLLRMKNIMLTYDTQANISSLKRMLSHLITKVQKYRDSLDEILGDEETTALMNLTHLMKDPSLYTYPIPDEILMHHEEVEQSLECYLTDFASIESNLEVVATQLVGFEQRAATRLDSSRNQLLTVNIVLMIFMCFSVLGAYLVGAFAMNLNNSAQLGTVHGGFSIVVGGVTAIIFVGTFTVYKLLVFYSFITEEDPEKERLIKSIHI